MRKLFIEDIDLTNKKVIMRVDFNVPLKNSKVDNDKRIRAALPSIKYIIENNASLILMSHLGRPKGKVNNSLSLKPVAEHLAKLLGMPVKFSGDCTGSDTQEMIDGLKAKEVLLLENLRFKKEETDNDLNFAKILASYADIYINDAFGTAHRAHASTQGITKYMNVCASGYLLDKEIKFLGNTLENPETPFTAIIGGAKISGKIDVIESLLPKVDYLLIGGGMALTFLKAKGYEIGKSLCEEDKLDVAKKLLEKGKDKIFLPTDFILTDSLNIEAGVIGEKRASLFNEIPQNMMAVDIGQTSIEEFSKIIDKSKTIVWNGPMGVFEIDELAKGTFAVAQAMAQATSNGAVTIIGGGDSASAVEKAGLENQVSHVSTGGGASLEFLEGKQLPGVESLSNI